MPKALADVGRILVRYIATDNPVATKRVGRKLLLAGDSLVMFPHRGRRGRQAEREAGGDATYLIVYQVPVRMW